MNNLPQKPYTVRVDGRTTTGWHQLFAVEHTDRTRALRDFQWAADDTRYGPHGTRRMTLLGPDRTTLPAVTR